MQIHSVYKKMVIMPIIKDILCALYSLSFSLSYFIYKYKVIRNCMCELVETGSSRFFSSRCYDGHACLPSNASKSNFLLRN